MRKSTASRSRFDLTIDALSDHALIREWLSIDRTFHGLLYDMNSQWHRLEMGLLAMEDRLRRNLDEHIGLAGAILARRGDRARDLMVAHLANLETTITSLMAAFHFPSGE